MKKLYLIAVSALFYAGLSAQANSNPYGIIYTILNTKCQNSSCHSSTSGSADNLKFDQDSASVYNQIFGVKSALWAASVTKHNLLINQEMPYQSFLLRKIAGAGFDTDLSIDSTGEGNLMVDINGTQLANYEIEYVRQWIRYGALPVYSSSGPQPDFPTYYQYYMDTNYTHGIQQIAFLPKPPAPTSSNAFQFRMGPQFLPVTGAIEQEVTEQQQVYFPYLPQITEIDGHMNNQSHHLLLFQYQDSLSARDPNYTTGFLGDAPDITNIGQVTPATASFTEPFSGNKNLVAAFQTPDNQTIFPAHTAMFWDQVTYMDFDYHTKNYNATAVLPCDFYVTLYYEPRNPNTIQMVSELQNNDNVGQLSTGLSCGTPTLLVNTNALPQGTQFIQNYNDNTNASSEQTRYLFMAAGHTHKFGTSFYLIRKDTTGALADTIYDGGYDYANQVETGAWDWHHPPIEYWNNSSAAHEGLEPVVFGKNGSGLTANTGWVSDSSCVRFGFTTNDEMQLFYYMYTLTDPATVEAINTPTKPDIYFEVMPNPMSNNGKLVYNLDKDSRVEASIVDVTGKTVAELTSENELTGLHTITLNNGQNLSSGIYFAKLIINGNFYTKKFVVTE